MQRCWSVFYRVIAALVMLSGSALALAQSELPFQEGPNGQLTLTPEAQQAAIDDMLTMELKNKNKDKTEAEKVYLVEQMPLLPALDSPIKDLYVVGYKLSDGTEGYVVNGPVVPPGSPEPSGLEVEADLEAGTYTAREIPVKELKPIEKGGMEVIIQEPPEEESPDLSEPLSNLSQHLLNFFLPSALACPPPLCPSPTYVHSFSIQGLITGIVIAETRGKMYWGAGPQCQVEIRPGLQKGCTGHPGDPGSSLLWAVTLCDQSPTYYGTFPEINVKLNLNGEFRNTHQSGNTTLSEIGVIRGWYDGSWYPTFSCSKSGRLKNSITYQGLRDIF